MKEICLDVETTTFQKGNPFSRRNRLCTVGLGDATDCRVYAVEYDNSPYGVALGEISELVRQSDLLIGFNIKFDIHWLRRYIDDLSVSSVWDCQLGEFILNHQSEPYPSLGGSLPRYGLQPKLDVVRTQYWDLDIDTPEIPWHVLAEYQEQDVKQTYQLYQLQKERFERGDPRLYETFKLQCKDLLILEDMEFFGMKLDVDEANKRAGELGERLKRIDAELLEMCGDERINWGSTDHLSVFLYGGVITYRVREKAQRILKSGVVKEYERWGTLDVEYPRLVKPNPRSESKLTRGMSDEELARLNREKLEAGHRPLQRLYSVDEDSLRGINGTGKVKRIIKLLLERSELEKLYGTYYKGLPELIEEMDWPPGEMHGNFNQCVVVTGRLSSSRPNLQNLAGDSKQLYVSRYV